MLDLTRHEIQQHPHTIRPFDSNSDALYSGFDDLTLDEFATRGDGSRHFGDGSRYDHDTVSGSRFGFEYRDTQDSYVSRTRSLRTNGRQLPRDSMTLPRLLEIPKVDTSKYTKPTMPTMTSTPQRQSSRSHRDHNAGASFRPSESDRHTRQERESTTRPSTSSKHRPTTVREGMDPYLILHLKPSASRAEIEKAVREMRIRYHPDKRKRAGMSSKEIDCIDEQAKLVGQAAEILLDPGKRSNYDSKSRY
ncbi:MAG: hypothetical protein Q9174_004665 [Haloplaca sp. 1 TL-2023]